MRVKSNKLALRVLSTATFLAMVSSCATAAFAGTYYMEDGSISIVAKTDGNYITQGDINDKKDEGETVITNHDSETASKNTVTIKAEEDCTANVTLDNVNIDASDTGKAAIYTEGKVTLELDGSNTLTGGEGHAALEKISNAKNNVPDENYTLTLQDETTGNGKTGSLNATGGAGGAGIGGGSVWTGGYANNITITGGTVTANGGEGGAGIGGGNGSNGNGASITISGKNTAVTATGGAGGAGIGGGKSDGSLQSGQGFDITVKDGAYVEANGSGGGAGIGGGDGSAGGDSSGLGKNITITGKGTTVDATGGSHGAGIGGGGNSYQSAAGSASNITISGDKTHVTATGGLWGAGIGGGAGGGVKNSTAGNASNITISGGTVIATGNGSAAGIGGGSGVAFVRVPKAGSATNITISGGNVTAIGGKGFDSISGGAGIGGGTDSLGQSNGGAGSNITISGGTVNAVGGRNSAGIGGGDGAGCSGITISGGTVTASSEDGAAGIGGGRWAGAGTADSAGVTITNGTVTANGGAGAAGIGDGANNVSEVGSVISITGGTVTANGGAGEAAGIGNGENDANDAAVNISATTARLDVTAVTQGSDEAITGGDDMTMAELNNQFSGVVRFFRGTNHYNTVHNGKYVGMDDNNADEHLETDAHIWGSTEIIRQATPTEQGILRHHCAVDGCKGYYEEFFDYVAPAEPVTPAPTDPDTPDVPGTSDSTPGTPAQGTPADAATADAVPGAATAEEVSVTPSGAQTVTAAALPKTGVNWLAAVGSAISGMVLLAAGFVLDRKSRRQN